jgi:hypothetical protein
MLLVDSLRRAHACEDHLKKRECSTMAKATKKPAEAASKTAPQLIQTPASPASMVAMSVKALTALSRRVIFSPATPGLEWYL